MLQILENILAKQFCTNFAQIGVKQEAVPIPDIKTTTTITTTTNNNNNNNNDNNLSVIDDAVALINNCSWCVCRCNTTIVNIW